MLRICSPPNTRVSPSATMNSHDASISPSIRMVSARFISAPSPPLWGGAGGGGGGGGGRGREPLVALRAAHAALDPVQRLDAGRRIDAFGGKVLDVDEIDPPRIRVVFGAAKCDRLDRLMTGGELHLDQSARRLPFEPRHRRDQFVGRRFLAAVGGHRLFPRGLPEIGR